MRGSLASASLITGPALGRPLDRISSGEQRLSEHGMEPPLYPPARKEPTTYGLTPPACSAVELATQEWLQLPWSRDCIERWLKLSESGIALKELLACAIWGRVWQHSHAIAHCDNSAVVASVNTGYSWVPQIMHLLCCLYFIWAHFQFSLQAVHVLGTANRWADDISRNDLTSLFSQVPTVSDHRKIIPQPLLELLII